MKLTDLKNKLIISCQSVGDEPLNDAYIVGKMAYACVVGGAKILRMSQKDHIKKAKEYVDVPIIGLIKQPYDDSEIFITPTMKEIDDLAEVGVDAIALDATLRKRPNGIELGKLINDAKSKYPDILFMADCATIEEVENANTLPFDIVSTTLCGYTKESEGLSNISNNYEFAKTAMSVSEKPLVIEGGVWEPNQAKELLELGAYAVVVGSAITRPHLIVEHWMKKVGQTNE